MAADGGTARRTTPKKEKIAILGGGMGGLAAAFEMTRDPNWRDRFESITVYQLGWRLGGKCASSRDFRFGRIEEHGIHGFLGSYYNALPMMMECFDELAEARRRVTPEDRPELSKHPQKDWPKLETFEDAFAGQDYGMLWELVGREVRAWPQAFPNNKRKHSYREPETRDIFEISMAGVARAVIVMAILALPFGKSLKTRIDRTIDRWAAGLGKRLARKVPRPGIARLHRFWNGVKPFVHGVSQLTTPLRRQFILLDHLATLVFGAFADETHIRGFDHLDEENFNDFLRRHGAHADTMASPLNLNFINMTYQYPDGDTSKTASMAAGCYLRWSLWATSFVGSFIWRFGAGSGEVLIAPLYDVLKARGVKFEFFQKVTNLGLSKDKTRVESIAIEVQATPIVPDYDPLVTWKGVPCWPDRPRYEQLAEGDALKKPVKAETELAGYGYDLESYWSMWKPTAKPRTLAHGKDFDRVVLAISIGAFEHICPELTAADRRWKAMVEKIRPLSTMAMQVWLTKSAAELGWDVPRLKGDAIFSTTWINPQNGHAELAELIRWEDWNPESPPRGLWYFCGLLRDDYNVPKPGPNRAYANKQKARVKYESIQALQSAAGILLPKATTALQCPPGDQFGLDFSLLYSGYAHPRTGMNRFDSQFWRANIDPTERYVPSPPGTPRYRLRSWDSGFSNLVLAGDWIYTGLNVGSVEGTVMSGRLASHALTGQPPLSHIVGYPADDPTAPAAPSRLVDATAETE